MKNFFNKLVSKIVPNKKEDNKPKPQIYEEFNPPPKPPPQQKISIFSGGGGGGASKNNLSSELGKKSYQQSATTNVGITTASQFRNLQTNSNLPDPQSIQQNSTKQDSQEIKRELEYINHGSIFKQGQDNKTHQDIESNKSNQVKSITQTIMKNMQQQQQQQQKKKSKKSSKPSDKMCQDVENAQNQYYQAKELHNAASVKHEISRLMQDLKHPQDILSNIPKQYQQEKNLKQVLRIELSITQNFPPMERIDQLEKIQKIITSELGCILKEHYHQFVQIMFKVSDLGGGLKNVHKMSSNSRDQLIKIKKGIVNNMVKVVQEKSKLIKLRQIKAQIEAEIRRFAIADKMINQSMHKGQFANAIQMNDRMLQELEIYVEKKKQENVACFKCLTQLKQRFSCRKSKLKQAFWQQIQLIPKNFDDISYQNIIDVYLRFNQPFEKKQSLDSLLLKCFRDNLNITIQLLQNHISTPNDKDIIINEFQDFIFSAIKWMYHHHRITRFHDSKISKSPNQKIKSQHQRLKALFLSDRRMFWRQIQSKTAHLLNTIGQLLCGDINTRDVFYIFYCVNIFEQVGSDFSREVSKELPEVVKIVQKRYFENFKKQQFTVLKQYLENDDWKRLPLPDNYKLPQFTNFLMDYPKQFESMVYGIVKFKNAFARFSDQKNPLMSRQSMMKLSQNSKAGLKYFEAQKENQEQKLTNVILCSAGLNFAKHLFKYFELLLIMRFQSFEIFLAVSQLFDYYIYFLYLNFVPKDFQKFLMIEQISQTLNIEQKVKAEQQIDILQFQSKHRSLKSHLIHFKDFIQSHFKTSNTQVVTLLSSQKISMSDSILASLNSSIQLQDNSAQQFELRLIGIQSAFYIFDIMKKSKSMMLSILKPDLHQYIHNYFNKSEQILLQFRQLVYNIISSQLVKMDPILTTLNNQNWSSGKEQTGASPYIERILYQMSQLDKKLKSAGGGCLPEYAKNMLKSACLKYLSIQLVDAIAKIKKISNFGVKALYKDMDCIEKAFAFNPSLETKKHMDYVRVVIGVLNIRIKDFIPWCDQNIVRVFQLRLIQKQEKYPLKVVNNLMQYNYEFQYFKKQEKKQFQGRVDQKLKALNEKLLF